MTNYQKLHAIKGLINHLDERIYFGESVNCKDDFRAGWGTMVVDETIKAVKELLDKKDE